MVSLSSKVETGHRDVVHDATMNYFGTRLATCSSDNLVKIFDVKSNGNSFPLAELAGHDGPVWQVNWAHHQFDNVLASCSHDRKVIVWKEINGKWQKSYEYSQHDASINAVSWAPHEYGLVFACCSTDCAISIVEFQQDVWKPVKIFKAHDQGCNSVSWAPSRATDSLNRENEPVRPKRIASGGNDRLVKIWKEESPDNWVLEAELSGHDDWVRDVAWAPSDTSGHSTVASCGLDGKVIIWRCNDLDGKKWTSKVLRKFDDVVWHVSWSECSTILAVSGGDNKLSLFQERIPGQWQRISDPEEEK